jgi:hypothetical protein
MNSTQRQIYISYNKFRDRFGFPPNTILVSANEEMDLNSAGLKLGSTFLGMKIIAAETIDGVTVGLILAYDSAG